jgi:5-methylcytosine-specific restriction endonuclease McrA
MPAVDKERERERKRKYWIANRERLLAYHKDYIKKNPYISRRKQKKYWAKNPEKAEAFNRKRRARVNKVEHIPYTKDEVLKKYGTDCHICGITIDLNAPRKAGKKGWEHGLHLDHLIPISKGGPDTIENVRPAHGMCNLSKGARGESNV